MNKFYVPNDFTSIVAHNFYNLSSFLKLNEKYFPVISLRYCVEFEVLHSSKSCSKLPPYNLLLEGNYALTTNFEFYHLNIVI